MSIFYWKIFPVCFVEGAGLTTFKKISEYIISAILLISIPIFYRERSKFDTNVLRLLIASIIVTIFSELMFTLYIHAYGLPNLIGHFLKIVSFYLIYLAIIKTGLENPYSLLFRELKESEELLRRERNRAQKYLDDAGVMFLVLDTDQRVTLINEKGCEILGCEQKNIIGKNWFENYIPERIRDEARKTFRELMAGNIKSVEYYENPVLTTSGDEKVIAWHNTVLRDQDGEIIGTLSSGDDITEHIEEQARRQAEQEFEKQRILGLRSDRLRSLGEMAAGIAHELNQPLQGVRGLAEHLMISIDRGWELTAEKIRERANLVVQQADRMTHIVDHIRIFAREAGKPETRPVQVNNVIKSSIGLLGAQFRSRGIQLETDLAENLPMISANPFSLEEVVINLLVNARDAAEENIGSSLDPRVALHTFFEEVDGEKFVKVQVMDNGTGIPEHILDKVFDPFFTTKGPDRGTGLGLSISRSIVEQFGGKINIQSTDGKGTTVTISLPVIS
jgi:PAS domain S-box-containing protein